MNQPLFWSLAILGLFIWLVFRPFATAPWKIMGAFGLLVLEVKGWYAKDITKASDNEVELTLSEDGQEGPRAFAEKRKPVWTGR